MKFLPWQGKVAGIALLIALAVNFAHYAVFRDGDYIVRFILAQLGFLPVSVYLVTVVVNELLGRREKLSLLNKLNMVIGSFFSEVGTELLRLIAPRGASGGAADRDFLLITADWKASDYLRARRRIGELDIRIAAEDVDWERLRAFLAKERPFLLSLLGNPNLLEHETFTELLWAVFHLAEELCSRADVAALSPADSEHLVGDIKRVQVRILSEWLDYMRHLQESYPYLFSLAVRTNPFHPDARAEVR